MLIRRVDVGASRDQLPGLYGVIVLIANIKGVTSGSIASSGSGPVRGSR